MKALLTAAAGALALGLAATPASAAMQLAVTDIGCDLYSANGCLFTFEPGDGNIFDDPNAYVTAYNAAHAATPAPEDLPELIYLGKKESGVDFDNDLKTVSFTDLPWDVSFFMVKSGSGQSILFGLDPATDTFTAANTRITNARGKLQGISHVSFFGVEGGGGGGGVPEPATWALMITGFGAAGAMLRRRKAALA